MRTISPASSSASTTVAAAVDSKLSPSFTISTTPPPTAAITLTQRTPTPWQSPVPYLFGGLAAMLGLIAFALLILACSYWKLSGQTEGRDHEQRTEDLENGNNGENEEKINSDEKAKGVKKIFEEKILVIMAGNEKPTFLATPVIAKVTSFRSSSSSSDSDSSTDVSGKFVNKSEKEMITESYLKS